MSGQLESQHYFREGDTVRTTDGRVGQVIEASALYALVAWDGGSNEEIDQFDPLVAVIDRAVR